MPSQIYPAIALGFQGFAPHLVHRFLLPLWRNERKISSEEAALFSSYGGQLSRGLKAYVRLLQLAKLLEQESSIEDSSFFTAFQLFGDLMGFFDSLGFTWSEMATPMRELVTKHSFLAARNIMLVAAHWQFNLAVIARRYPLVKTSYKFDVLELSTETVTFNDVVKSMTYSPDI